jgi:hypothetical protein
MDTNGHFYTAFTADPQVYRPELKNRIEQTVEKLLNMPTDEKRPGMLLGKVQSGKTRTFEGVMALAFDNGYDVCIVLTKGTKALARQTYERIRKDFSQFVPAKMQVYDIMSLPKLSGFELTRKLVFVVKKEDDNLLRLEAALLQNYPALGQKRILLIDDEADFASVGYGGNAREGIQIRRVAKQVNDLRTQLPRCSFLQVTATPYGLYLQPKDIVINGNVFMPIRPAFTILVPVHGEYVGGDIYFPEDAGDNGHNVADHLHVEVSDRELDVLRKRDLRRLDLDATLTSPAIEVLRRAIGNFIVGTTIRQLQEEAAGREPSFYSFLFHTQTAKTAHEWQEEVVMRLKEAMMNAALERDPRLLELLVACYDDLAVSVLGSGFEMPPQERVIDKAMDSLREDHLLITKVNSDEEVLAMLDPSGQLSLRAPMNIFIGGQILDRGITIANLIGFYYGRAPKKFQQDTVLQHSRMYGFRSVEDIAVTRFYTTADIHSAMHRMQESDSALRALFERTDSPSVVCVQKAANNTIIPCSPNKILLSEVTTLKPHKRLLPVGFQTLARTRISDTVDAIDQLLAGHQQQGAPEAPFTLRLERAVDVLRMVYETMQFEEPGYPDNLDEMIGALCHLSQSSDDATERGLVWGIWRGDRDIKRYKSEGRFSNAPDTSTQEGRVAREVAIHIPALLFLRQNGREEDGWRGSPFYWPVIIAPQNTKTALFATQVRPDQGPADNADDGH